ncbi:MAG: nuclease A inhibitor family protein [Timaviella obliquedivisa GSE-PSE-MK23-08B]|jgi:hypothetical protein|nr:nuclease A inhibitor family protein [Timaviella obliquedivisa GSE-PSE-MK23-08B]
MSQAEVVPDLKFSTSNPDEESAVASLKAIVEGLTWMSESDYPFKVLQLPDRANSPSTSELLQLTEHDKNAFVETISMENFFASAIQPQDWHEDADKQRIQRFQTLLQWLEQHLSSVEVYRVGTITIDVYIIGQIASGAWVSLSTKVVET